jgi:hypothetical protein
MLKTSKSILLILLALLLLTDSQGQNNTYSPYSRFGIGEIANNVFARNQAMGGIGIGLRDPNHLNYFNPAANSAQDTMSFILSTGLTVNATRLQGSEGTHDVGNVTLSHLAIGFPLSRWWKTSIGLVPYSRMGYNIMDVDLATESEQFYEGTGGINQFFFGNAINLTRNLSAGVTASYLFGSLTQSRRLGFPLSENRASVTSQNRTILGDFHFRYGMQYSARIGSNNRLTMGLIYENKAAMNTEHDRLIINELNTGLGQIRDTIQYFREAGGSVELPSNIGIGASFSRDNRFLVGADYSMQNWSQTSFLDSDQYSLVNSSNFNIGAQFIPDHTDYRNYLNRIHYRLGFRYTNSYLELRDRQLNDYGITFGFGLPYANTNTTFNFSVDIGRRGTTDLNLIRENYVVFNFSVSLYDYWFLKWRYD